MKQLVTWNLSEEEIKQIIQNKCIYIILEEDIPPILLLTEKPDAVRFNDNDKEN